MNTKFHTNVFRGMLIISFLLALTLTACSGTPVEISPTETTQYAAEELEITNAPTSVVPSPVPTWLAPSDDSPVYSPIDIALAIKPDIPPQTINGVTASIDWAYADESRIAVMYTITGLDWPDNIQMDPERHASLSSQVIHNISGETARWTNGLAKNGTLTGYVDQMLTANAVNAADTPVVDLKVAIPVVGMGAILVAPPSPGQNPQPPVTMNLPNVGAFHFAFELPIYQGIKLMDINQTVEANKVAITLKSLILNRSHVDAMLCYQKPSIQGWGPDVRFSLAGQPGMENLKGDSSNLFLGGCVGMGVNVHYDGGPTQLKITIPKITSSLPDSWQLTEDYMVRANQRLADKGIVVAYNNDIHNPFKVVQRPEAATDMEIYPLIWDALADWYEGPWEFTVAVQQ